LELNECSFGFGWKYPKIDIKDISIEERGKFRIEGELSIDQRRLRGVCLFGTLDDPEQDLSPRVIELFKQSPGAYLGLLFRQFEGGLNKAFSHD